MRQPPFAVNRCPACRAVFFVGDRSVPWTQRPRPFAVIPAQARIALRPGRNGPALLPSSSHRRGSLCALDATAPPICRHPRAGEDRSASWTQRPCPFAVIPAQAGIALCLSGRSRTRPRQAELGNSRARAIPACARMTALKAKAVTAKATTTAATAATRKITSQEKGGQWPPFPILQATKPYSLYPEWIETMPALRFL